jgi:hypothetical protein
MLTDIVIRESSTNTKLIQIVTLRDKVEEEVQKRVFVRYRCNGASADYPTFTPDNGDRVRSGGWAMTQSEEEPTGQIVGTRTKQRQTEEKQVDNQSAGSSSGFDSHSHNHTHDRIA